MPMAKSVRGIEQVFELDEVVILVGDTRLSPSLDSAFSRVRVSRSFALKPSQFDAARPALHALQPAALRNLRKLVEVGGVQGDRFFDQSADLQRPGSRGLARGSD